MKKGQMKLSFGMIFSVILIVVFLAFGFYAIKTFLGIQNSAMLQKVVDDMQFDIENIWLNDYQSNQSKEYTTPTKITHACFVDFRSGKKGTFASIYDDLDKAYSGDENLVFYPLKAASSYSVKIKRIDIEETTQENNPFCLENINGKIIPTFVKKFGDPLITITE